MAGIIEHTSLCRIAPRGLSKPAAAAYCGCECLSTFDDWIKRGIIPGTQAVTGSMWWVDPAVLDSPQLRETLRALSERRRIQRDRDDRTPQIPGLSEV